MNTRAVLVSGAAIMLAGAIPLAVIFGSDGGPRFTAPAAAQATALPQIVAAPGVVEPYSEERTLAAIVPGPIISIGAQEGDAVKKGQIIAEIDNADLKAELDAANARVLMRQNELQKLENGARPEEREAAAAELSGADVALRLARTMLDRRSSLAQAGVTSQTLLDQSRADLDSATAHRDLMAERDKLINAPPRAEDVAIAEANLKLAQADAAALEAQIEKTRLRSPIDGVLLRRFKALGETVSVQPPTLVAIIGDTSRLRVRADVDEDDVARVAVGQPATVMADAYGDERFSGRVARVGVRLGPKQVRTDAATEKADTKVLQVLIDLDEKVHLPVGLRVDVMFQPTGEAKAASISPAG